MASTSIRNIDVSQWLRQAGAQFSGLDRRDPSSWPAVPRYALFLCIAALVVAPSLAPASILDALRGAIDPVFLPRPLVRLEALPRNATGKLARADALAALARA